MFLIPLVLAAVVAITAAADYEYTSVVAKGVTNTAGTHLKEFEYIIPTAQMTGEVKYPKDYYCEKNGYKYLPLKLQVEVQSNEPPADIQLNNELTDAKITRTADWDQALVLLKLDCSTYTRSAIRQKPIANGLSRSLRPVQK